MPERDFAQRQLKDSEPQGNGIDYVCSVVRLPNRRYGDSFAYLGWTKDRKPALTQDKNSLSPQALKNVVLSTESNENIFNAESNIIVPTVFQSSLNAKDIQDTEDHKYQDFIRYLIKDEKGNQQVLWVHELNILQAASNAIKYPWQDVGSEDISDLDLVTSRPKQSALMYTLFTEGYLEGQTSPEYFAVMLDPTKNGYSNSQDLERMLRQTARSLILIDKAQPSGLKKGYERIYNQLVDQSQVKGGFLSKAADIAKQLDWANLSDKDIEDLKGETDGKSFGEQVKVFSRFMGWTDYHSDSKKVFNLETADFEELDKLCKLFNASVSRYFRGYSS